MNTAETEDLISVLPTIADRVGLTWTMRTGTMVSATETEAMVRMDGDTVPVPAIIVNGAPIGGSRVWVLVNKGGHYLVGSRGAQTRIFSTIQACDASLVGLPTIPPSGASTPTAVSGTRISVDTPDCDYMVTGIFDFRERAAGANTCIGYLAIDDQASGGFESANAIRSLATLEERGTTPQQWGGSLDAGVHTFELFAARTTLASGTQSVEATHTTIKVELFA